MERIIHARHLIAFLHFVTLSPWPFDLLLTGGRGIVMDYPCAKFDDFSLRRFGFIVQTDRQTDRQNQTESERRMIAILTRLPYRRRV